MICKNCGHDNSQESAFCAKCGTKLEETAAPVEQVIAQEPVQQTYEPAPEVAPLTMAPEPPKKKGKGKLILIIAIIVVLLAGIGVGGYFAYQYFCGDNDAQPVVADNSADKEEVTKLVEDYIAEAKDYDIHNANKFLTEKQGNLFGGGAEEFKNEVYDECVTMGTVDFCYGLIDKWAESRELTLKEVKKDGDKYICTVEIKQIDEEEMEDIIWDALSEEDNLIDEIRDDAIDEGLMTGEEEELDDEVLDELNGRLEARLNDMFEEDIEALEPVTTETEIVVVKVDGEWKIDAEESELY